MELSSLLLSAIPQSVVNKLLLEQQRYKEPTASDVMEALWENISPGGAKEALCPSNFIREPGISKMGMEARELWLKWLATRNRGTPAPPAERRIQVVVELVSALKDRDSQLKDRWKVLPGIWGED